MERPKHNIHLSRIEWALEVAGAIGLIMTFVLIVLNYSDLPQIMPRHFNVSGKPDGYSSKELLWILPTITLLIYTLMTIGSRFPHKFNYPLEITMENAKRQYGNSVMMMRVLKTIIVIIFFYLTFAIIQIGLGKVNGIGTYFLPIFLIAVFGTVGVFLYRGNRMK